MIKLYPHQQIAFEWLQEQNRLLCDETGAGKTYPALYAAYALAQGGHIVWITLNTAKDQFKRIISETFPDVDVVILYSQKRFPNPPVNQTIFICHYEGMHKFTSKLNNVGITVVVGDEIQNIKNRKTRQAQAVKKLHAQYKLGLSGTPTNKRFTIKTRQGNLEVPNPEELWSLLNWLAPKEFSSYWAFVNKYVDYVDFETHRKAFRIKTDARMDYLRLLKRFMLMRTKQSIGHKVAEYIPIHLNMGGDQSHLYRQIVRGAKQDALIELSDNVDLVILNKLTLNLRLQQVAENPILLGFDYESIKLEWLRDKLPTLANYLIITRFRETALRVAHEFRIPAIVGGELLPTNLHKEAKLVGTIDALAGALDFPHIDYAIFVGMTFNRIQMIQARDRIDRLSNLRPATVYYLIAQNSVDEIIYKATKDNISAKELLSMLLSHYNQF